MAAARQATLTWYEVLGVPPTASADAIKQAFRAAALRLHPDKQQGGGGGGGGGGEPAAAAAADAEYLLVQQAWEVSSGWGSGRQGRLAVQRSRKPCRLICRGLCPLLTLPCLSWAPPSLHTARRCCRMASGAPRTTGTWRWQQRPQTCT